MDYQHQGRLAFYRAFPGVCPGGLQSVYRPLYGYASLTWKMPGVEELNKELVQRIAAPLTGNYGDDVGRITKLKRQLVKIHPQLFIWLNPFFEKLKARQG